jgi:hypothetical protein
MSTNTLSVTSAAIGTSANALAVSGLNAVVANDESTAEPLTEIHCRLPIELDDNNDEDDVACEEEKSGEFLCRRPIEIGDDNVNADVGIAERKRCGIQASHATERHTMMAVVNPNLLLAAIILLLFLSVSSLTVLVVVVLLLEDSHTVRQIRDCPHS